MEPGILNFKWSHMELAAAHNRQKRKEKVSAAAVAGGGPFPTVGKSAFKPTGGLAASQLAKGRFAAQP